MRNLFLAIVISASILGINMLGWPAPIDDPSPVPGSGGSVRNPVNQPPNGRHSNQPGNDGFNSCTPPADPIGSQYVAEPNNILVLVNKKHRLPSNYVPPDLTQPDIPFIFSEDLPKKLLRKEAALALSRLFSRASEEGIALLGVSGYRSYQTQKAIFENKARLLGETEANRVSARPGQSEHQTGLAMDITSAGLYSLSTAFGSTPEGKWVAQNAGNYGFIIRYPEGKEGITGYVYEPWHLRYVGIATAQYINRHSITLEEYLENT